MLRSTSVALTLASLFVVGCSSNPSAPPAPPKGPDDGLPAVCNPLRAEGVCLLPFPSSAYLDDDPSTETGYRLALEAEAMPQNVDAVRVEPGRLNTRDGFSAAAQILVHFPERLDPATLVPEGAPEPSLDGSGSTLLLDMDTGALVAHFAELDQQVEYEGEKQGLILRPLTRLELGHRYAVAITKKVKALGGGEPTAPPGYAAALADSVDEPRAKKVAARMPEVLAALAAAGVAEDDVLMAWDYVTASQTSTFATSLGVRERTLEAVPQGGLGYTITSVEDDFSEHTLRRVRGTFTVPRFLSNVDRTIAETELLLDPDGAPTSDGTYEAPFTLIIPRRAETESVGLLVFGHGFLGSGEGELGDDTGSFCQQWGDDFGYAMLATDWSGLSKWEGFDSDGSQAAAVVLSEVSNIPWITDRLHQALANNMVLARTGPSIVADAMVAPASILPIDASRVDFMGISLGGIMGGALMGLSPDLMRGVLNVSAGGWSTMMQRSLNWSLFELVLNGKYPSKLDQLVVISLFQSHMDPVDALSFAPHTIGAPLADNPPKQLLQQMAMNDAQVPNLASEIHARSLGLSLLAPSPKAVWGMTSTEGPLSSGLAVFDLGAEAPPPGNQAASGATENPAHGGCRNVPEAQQQMERFLRGGEVESF
jgi:hypothetical protein